MEWNDEFAIDWTKVTRICGFRHGSCNDKECGAALRFRSPYRCWGGLLGTKNADQWKCRTPWMPDSVFVPC